MCVCLNRNNKNITVSMNKLKQLSLTNTDVNTVGSYILTYYMYCMCSQTTTIKTTIVLHLHQQVKEENLNDTRHNATIKHHYYVLILI